MADFMDVFRLFRKFSKDEEKLVDVLNDFVSKDDLFLAKRLLKQRKIKGSVKKNPVNLYYPSLVDVKDQSDFVLKLNGQISDGVFERSKTEFSSIAFDWISDNIAPNIIGMGDVKKAVALQLLSNEQIHILLLGDPGTGKTDILRSAETFADISSFGLGSGTSSAGLGISYSGDEKLEGLLPLANKGVCLIDELNLMKKEDRAFLYSAMEKGFITYDKKGQHQTIETFIKVLATANPKGDKFEGQNITQIKREIPFDSALLSRFHLVFFIRKPDLEGFKEIAKTIVSSKDKTLSTSESEFIKKYIQSCKGLNVEVGADVADMITEFVGGLKVNERKFLIDISPRIVVGMKRLVTASAKIECRDKATEKDFLRVKEIIKNSLSIS